MKIVYIILPIILFIFSSLYELQMLQQNSYNDLNRFQKFLVEDTKKNWKSLLLKFFFFLYLVVSTSFKIYDKIIIGVVLAILILDAIDRFIKHNDKLKLKFTKRLIRILTLDYLFFILVEFVSLGISDNLYLATIMIYILINTSILTFIVKLLSPVEKMIFNKYKKQALEKLNRMNYIT